MNLPTSFDELSLDHGKHRTRTEGMCAMEAVAWFAGEKHSDHPDCVDATINELMIELNDTCTDAQRDEIVKPLIPLCLDTACWINADEIEGLVTDGATMVRGTHDGFGDIADRAFEDIKRRADFVVGDLYEVSEMLAWTMWHKGNRAAVAAATIEILPSVIRELARIARERLDREPTITIPTDFTTLQGATA